MIPHPPMHAAELILAETDVRTIVHLLGEIIAMRGDFNACRRKLMDGLCSIIGADSWLWCIAYFESGKPLAHSGILHGGFDDEQFSWFLQAINHPSTGAANRVAAEKLMHGKHVTLPLSEIDDPAGPVFSRESAPLWQKAGVGTLMLSLHAINPTTATGVGLYRRPGKPDFNERERLIAHILLTEVTWLHYENFPDQSVVLRLFPRHRTVLNLLCDGWPRKKIAGQLGISENTVHGYVKEIFRHFRVASHSELMARFRTGIGGTR